MFHCSVAVKRCQKSRLSYRTLLLITKGKGDKSEILAEQKGIGTEDKQKVTVHKSQILILMNLSLISANLSTMSIDAYSNFVF